MGISVLMSVYEKECPEYLDQALESIVNQTKSCDEIVLIKDGYLGEGLEKVIARYQENYPELMHLYQFNENVMLGKALAKGVKLCCNEVIARMDTDDIAVSNRLKLQYDYLMKHSEISVVGGFIEEFNEKGETFMKKMPIEQDEIIRYIKYRNPLNHMTVMFRKKDVLAAGNYRHFPLLEDYYLWNRMAEKGFCFHNIPEVLVRARSGNNMYRRRGGRQYFKSHKKLKKLQYSMALTNRREYIWGIIGTYIFTLQPNWVRSMVYKKVLRR